MCPRSHPYVIVIELVAPFVFTNNTDSINKGLPPLKNDDVTLLHLLAEGMNLLTHPITISFWPRDIARTDQDDIPVETQFYVIVIWITGCVLPERRAFNVHGSGWKCGRNHDPVLGVSESEALQAVRS